MTYDIAFGLDAPYAQHAAALIRSIVRYAPGAAFRFLVLHSGIPAARRVVMERSTPSARFVWIEVTAADIPPYLHRQEMGHVNFATLFRLCIEKLAPADSGRVLYLDT